MNYALDTNAYSSITKKKSLDEALQQLSSAINVYIPSIVLGELRGGFRVGSQFQENETFLQRFLGRPRISILHIDEQTTFEYGNLFARLRKQGIPIPTNDLWIAALVLQHGLTLCTNDKHFDNIPEIEIFTL